MWVQIWDHLWCAWRFDNSSVWGGSHIAAGCGGAEETGLPRAAPLGADGQGKRYFRLGAEAGARPQALTDVFSKGSVL